MVKILFVCLVTASFLVGCASSQAQEKNQKTPSESSVSQKENQKDMENAPISDNPSFQNFAALDLDGNDVNQDVFQNADLTVVNVWGTFCSICINEMPELGELSEEYKDKNVQFVGIVIDTLNQDATISAKQVQLAKDIVEKTQANYLHLLPSIDLIQIKLAEVTGVPETFFIDKNGNVIGESVYGAIGKEKLKEVIDERLEDVTENEA